MNQKLLAVRCARQLWIIFLLLLIQSCAFSQTQKDTVFITRTGEKYHRETCQYLRYSSYSITKEEAIERGYTPCSVCKPGTLSKTVPPRNTPDRVNAPAETNKSATSRQCTGITKAGARCKRMTTNANGKCYQHQ